MFSFKPKTRSDALSALVFTPGGIATATIIQNKHGKPVLQQCKHYIQVPGQELDTLLKRAVAETHLNKTACSTLLEPDDYQLLMVEAPEVPSTELKAAIRWRVRDLIDFHIDDAVLDVFDVPPSGARGVQEHLYTVVARSTLVKEKAEAMHNAGASLEFIDIPELALRNIAARIEADTSGQATLYFGADRGLLTLTRESTLYLARGLDIGFTQLQESPDLVERLALELQRSMDYYDRHFQQAPINAITLCPLPVRLPFLAEQLAEQTGIAVHELKLDELVEHNIPIDHELFAQCLLAIGSALRTDSTSL